MADELFVTILPCQNCKTGKCPPRPVWPDRAHLPSFHYPKYCSECALEVKRKKSKEWNKMNYQKNYQLAKLGKALLTALAFQQDGEDE